MASLSAVLLTPGTQRALPRWWSSMRRLIDGKRPALLDTFFLVPLFSLTPPPRRNSMGGTRVEFAMPDANSDRLEIPETVPAPNPTPGPEGRDTPASIRVLRLLALIATTAVLVWQTTSLARIRPRQEYGFVVLALAALAVAAALAVLLPAATRCLVRNMDLLVPLGLWIPLDALLNALIPAPALAAVLTPAWSVNILTLSFSLSLAFMAHVFLGIVYAGWTTVLIIQAVTAHEF